MSYFFALFKLFYAKLALASFASDLSPFIYKKVSKGYLFIFGIICAIFMIGAGILIGISWQVPSLTKHQVENLAFTTIVQEADTTFFVTGYYDLDTTVRVKDDKTMWGISLGTTEVNLRVPGRVSYGFNIGQLKREDIQVLQGDTVLVLVPPMSIYSVEPYLEKMDMQTEVGWARLYAYSGQALEHQAMKRVPSQMRGVAENRLKTSKNTYKNTEKAIRRIVTPMLQSVGMTNPVVVVRPKMTITPSRK